jgi:hypothetical protein
MRAGLIVRATMMHPFVRGSDDVLYGCCPYQPSVAGKMSMKGGVIFPLARGHQHLASAIAHIAAIPRFTFKARSRAVKT